MVSLSARRAWIEIVAGVYDTVTREVALRKESVDRNLAGRHLVDLGQVALRKESVDRNHAMQIVIIVMDTLSLSARRAWIEIGTLRSSNSVGYRRSPQGERG